jgi:hypothetical protein
MSLVRGQAIVSFHLNALPAASAELEFRVGNIGGEGRVPLLPRVLQRNEFCPDNIVIYNCISGRDVVRTQSLVDRTENVSRARHT